MAVNFQHFDAVPLRNSVNDFIGCIGSCDSTVWRPYIPGEPILHYFSNDEWNRMLPDITSDNELSILAVNNPDTVAIRVLSSNSHQHEDFGIVFLFLTDCKSRRLTFHGGLWKRTPRSLILIYAALYDLFSALLNRNYRITSSSQTNPAAVKFMSGLGFRVNRRINGRSYYYLTEKLLEQSPLISKLKSNRHIKQTQLTTK